MEHPCELAERVGKLLFDEKSSDVTFIVEGERLPAHKALVTISCDYFRAPLDGNMKESLQNEVELQDVPLRGFKLLMNYVYTGRLKINEVNENTILEVLEISHAWGFETLETKVRKREPLDRQCHQHLRQGTESAKMSLKWFLVSVFLYGEIVVVFLLILPFISPKTWNSFFKSRFARNFAAENSASFILIIWLFVLIFFDAIREMMKYSSLRHHEIEHSHIEAEMAQLAQSMKMFEAQRNFYIAGFSLILWLVIRRFVTLISFRANLMASNEATLRQALNAAVSQAIDGMQSGGANSANEVKELKAKLESLAKAIEDRDAMKTKSENSAKQYDELRNLHASCARTRASSKDD